MERTSVEIREVKITERFCDVCGKKANGRKCSICNRDLCEEHKHREYSSIVDHSEMYCKQCWNIGETYRRRIEVLAEIFVKEKEELYDQWKNGALEKIENAKEK